MGGQESKTRNRDELTAWEHIRKMDSAVEELSKSIDGLTKDVRNIWKQINPAESPSVAEDYVVVELNVQKVQEEVETLCVALTGLGEKKFTLIQEMWAGVSFFTNKLKPAGNLQDLWIKRNKNGVANRPTDPVASKTNSECSQENETPDQAMHSSEFQNLLDNYKRTEKELRTVKYYLDEIKKEAGDIQEDNQVLKKKIEVVNNDKTQLAKKIALLESQRQTFDEGMKPKHEKDKKITEECDQQNVVSNAKRQDASLKPRHPENQQQLETCDMIQVQIFCRKKGDLTATISAKLTELLTDKFKGQTSGVTITTPETVDEIQDNMRLLVVCMHGSRLGTDTGNEIQGIKDLGRTALLIFHHKDSHALPNQASARVLTETSFKELGGIFDFAFLADKGIYECGMNTESTNGVVSFISKTVQK